MAGTFVSTIGAGKMKREFNNVIVQSSQMAINSGIPQDKSAFKGQQPVSQESQRVHANVGSARPSRRAAGRRNRDQVGALAGLERARLPREPEQFGATHYPSVYCAEVATPLLGGLSSGLSRLT